MVSLQRINSRRSWKTQLTFSSLLLDPVAGKYTSSRLETAMDRETKLDARLDVIVARERDVKFNEDAIDKSAENLKVSIQEVFNVDQLLLPQLIHPLPTEHLIGS